MLELKNLIKKFGDNVAVSDVSFSVGSGEVFALIGPNGSGKTTIIKTIAGLIRPSSGEIKVGGLNVSKEPALTKKHIGYIPDEPSVWPSMTGEEFLNFVGALFDMNESDRKKRISEILPLFGFEGIEKGYFEDYSRGNKQKFSILAALLHRPKLLLVDEPIVGLDPTSAEIAKNEFVNFAKSGGSVLLTTHTLPVAQEIATQIGILKDGKLVAAGDFKQLVSMSKLKRGATLEDVYNKLTN